MAKKNKTLIAILLMFSFFILIVSSITLYLSFSSTQSVFGTLSIYQDCYTATQTKTYGAVEGQCFIYTSNNIDYLTYVRGIQEKTNDNTQGSNVLCYIDTTTDTKLSLTCDVARKKDGTTVQVCSNNMQCYSQKCVNHVCKEGEPPNCIPGQIQCYPKTDSSYIACLLSGTWSGILYAGTYEHPGTCVNNEIVLSECGLGDKKCEGDILYTCSNFKWLAGSKDSACGYVPVPETTAYYRFGDNKCTEIQLHSYEVSINDYTSLSECNKNVVVTVSKQIYYRFSNNLCSQVQITPSEKTIYDYLTLDECKANIEVPIPAIETNISQEVIQELSCPLGLVACSDGSCRGNCNPIPLQQAIQTNENNTNECSNDKTRCSDGTCKTNCVASANIMKDIAYAGIGGSIILIIFLLILLLV